MNKIVRLLPERPASDDLALLHDVARQVRELAGIVGIAGQDAGGYVRERKEKLLASIDISEEEINRLIEKRNAARKKKDWATSDAVRDQLLAHNIELHDGPDGTSWEVKG